MEGTCLLVRCAVLLALGGCASERFGAEPPRILATERLDQVAKKPISTAPGPAKAANRRMLDEPAAIALPPWKIVAVAKPGATPQPAMPPTRLFERVNPSVYGVKVAPVSGTTSYGSAVAISPREAITNCHIVNQGKVIILTNGETSFTAEVSSADARSDRCFLKVLAGALEPVPGVRDFRSLAVGETVYTIGSPKGLDKTLGQGLLSGLRKVEDVEYVQITAPVSEGSSGGGVFDERGNLIGITTFTIRGSQNLNFAIAASEYWR